MKLLIELEIDLGNTFINSKDQDERDWLFNEILTKGDLSLHSNEIGDQVGNITKVVKCKEIIENEISG